MFRFILIILGLFFIHFLANGSAQQLDILKNLYNKCQSAAEKFDKEGPGLSANSRLIEGFLG